MRNRDADAAPLPATEIEVSMAADRTGLKHLAVWPLTLGEAIAVEHIGERSLSLVTAYLAGELRRPATAAEIADMLRTEPWFRTAHEKLLAAWQAPNAERAVSDAEVDAAYSRFQAMRTARSGRGKGA